ncbi:alpha-(1,3)-fucosyltransferase C [Eurytemora carolleeae]|uniref:alpha-(1,3)-fucosyltransferase C n=1 Tax=Eurytemora carolleeae TaxID=1294199 RepID=UPI000C783C8A|nr:alpha-(1,3)-fucosyltransferase C [Eurytemora carolleeae]|eukprot:XP_023326749.1 alpha-(1,3)-fucosyltransferase C-like [Eurytemora affinis]
MYTKIKYLVLTLVLAACILLVRRQPELSIINSQYEMAKKSVTPSPSHLKPQKPLINTSAKETLEKLSGPGKKAGKKDLPKRILFWNDFYGSRNYGFCCGRNPFRKAKCPVWNCQTTKFRNESLETIDAIVFHQRKLKTDDLPAKRFPSQQYVFLSLESPSYKEKIVYKQWNQFFNLTMTYRLDSDVPMPYGTVVKTTSRNKTAFGLEILEEKTGLAAWFVSHCNTVSQRELVVKKLMKHLPDNSVHIYGSCGTLKCNDKEECWKMVSKSYKFYFSLENSICKDYVTEKLFEAMKYNVIPVVLGGADYADMLPPKSFINVEDFKSIKELGEYLTFLDRTPDEYLKYFKWKTSHEVLNSKKDINAAFCRLCAKLHEDPKHKSIGDLEDWWVTQSKCRN